MSACHYCFIFSNPYNRENFFYIADFWIPLKNKTKLIKTIFLTLLQSFLKKINYTYWNMYKHLYILFSWQCHINYSKFHPTDLVSRSRVLMYELSEPFWGSPIYLISIGLAKLSLKYMKISLYLPCRFLLLQLNCWFCLMLAFMELKIKQSTHFKINSMFIFHSSSISSMCCMKTKHFVVQIQKTN